jgi:hypothetical protein
MPPLPPSTSLQLSTALLYSIMFTYLPAYRVLICVEHQHAVYGLDEHLKRHHGLPAAKRRELRAAYAGLVIDAPTQVSLPAPNSAPIAQLGRAQDACHRLCLMIRLCLVWLFGPITSADRSCENRDARRYIMYSRRFLSTTTAYKTVAGLLLSIPQLSNFNESKPSIIVNNTSLSPCQLLLKTAASPAL